MYQNGEDLAFLSRKALYQTNERISGQVSHFIPCGVWEAVYLLDGLIKNRSDIPARYDPRLTPRRRAHLAGLLSIALMPRIRNWKDLKLYRPDPHAAFDHIDPLFSDAVDWPLIQTHLPDMLRVVLSIKAGRITASTLLCKLGTYSRKNPLYQAFRELGRVIRTEFLLNYIGTPSRAR